MLDCKRVLEGAKGEMHVLEVKDLDPDHIQSHLGGCMVSAQTIVGLLVEKSLNIRFCHKKNLISRNYTSFSVR